LNELNKRNWVINHCRLIDGDFRDVVVKYKCKKIAGNQNQSYRLVMKTLLSKQQT